MRLSPIARTGLLCITAVLCAFAHLIPAQAARSAPKTTPKAGAKSKAATAALTADQAYADVLRWASGSTRPEYLTSLYDRIERAAYRYNIIPEFALAVISAEAKYGNQISFARHESWAAFQEVTNSKPQVPCALDDLDTAFSELNQIMSSSKNVKEVLQRYWTGPDGTYNHDSYADFSVAVSKLYFGDNGLEKFVKERVANEAKCKYKPDYYNQRQNTCDEEPAWAGLATGDLAGYRSSLNSMPRLAEKLKVYENEADYARVARKFNKNLSEAESIVIARAVLTYCGEIAHGYEEGCQNLDGYVDPVLVMALIRAESNFKPNARSRVGALGLGQLMPATARGLGISNPLDPVQNLYGCIKYLERESYRWRDAPNKTALMLASYNAGPGAVQKYGGIPPYSETRNYVKIVTRYYNEFKR